MNIPHTNQSHPNNDTASPPNPPGEEFRPDSLIPARQRYVHLYMPLIAVVLILTNGPILSTFVRSANTPGLNEFVFVAASAIPVYLIGSLFYPKDRAPPSPAEDMRFTRKSEWCRAAVLITYGRIYGTPFNLQFYIMDLVASYAADQLIDWNRPSYAPQRRSEFLVALLWVGGSWVAFGSVPKNMMTLYVLLGMVDRMLWRAAYLALVDDVVKVLSRPNVRSWTGTMVLILTQSFTITALVWVALAWVKRRVLAGLA